MISLFCLRKVSEATEYLCLTEKESSLSYRGDSPTDFKKVAESSLSKIVSFKVATQVNSRVFMDIKGSISPTNEFLTNLCNFTVTSFTTSFRFSLERNFLGTSIFTSLDC